MTARAFPLYVIALSFLLVCPVPADEPEMIRMDLGSLITLEYDARLPEPDAARLKSLVVLWRRDCMETSLIPIVFHLVTYETLVAKTGINDEGGILLGTSRSMSFGPAQFAFGERGPLPIDVRRHDVWFWQIHDRVTLHELYHLHCTAVQPLLVQNLSLVDLERHIEQLTLLFMASDRYKAWLVERPWAGE